MPKHVIWDCKLATDRITAGWENFLTYLLVRLAPSDNESLENIPLNTSFVIDKSGSMSGVKLEMVKKAVKYVVDQFGDSDYGSIITFDTTSDVIVPSQRFTNSDKIKRDIDKIDTGGGTNMSEGMMAGRKEVLKQLSSSRINRVVLLTDGQTGSEGKCRDIAKQEAGTELSFTTIGVGKAFNEDLLIFIADTTGGNSYYIKDADDIPDIFRQELSGLQSVGIKNASLTLNLTSGIIIRNAYKLLPGIVPLDLDEDKQGKVNLSVGDLQKGESQAVLIELILPPRAEGVYRIAQFVLNYDVPQMGALAQMDFQDIIISYVSQGTPIIMDDEIMRIVDQVSVYKMVQNAESYQKSGDIDRATRLLKSAESITRNLGNIEMAESLAVASDEIEKTKKLSPETSKTVKFGTRRLS